MTEKHPDTVRLDWLNENIFNRENLDLMGRVDKTHNMWVTFAPKGVQGSVRAILDAAIDAENAQMQERAHELSKIFVPKLSGWTDYGI